MAKFESKVSVGDLARDKVTSFAGIVSGLHCWLTGCVTATLNPRELKDGVPLDPKGFDVPRLEVVTARAVVLDETAKLETEVNIGDLARDKLTGFSGIVTGLHFWLTGCVTATLNPRELKDGVPIATQGFDVMRIEVLTPLAVVLEDKAPDDPKRTGGPKPTPSRRRG